MRVMTSHYEIKGQTTFAQSKLNPPEHNIPAREKKNIETNSILARGESRMLPNDPLFKLHSVLI